MPKARLRPAATTPFALILYVGLVVVLAVRLTPSLRPFLTINGGVITALLGLTWLCALFYAADATGKIVSPALYSLLGCSAAAVLLATGVRSSLGLRGLIAPAPAPQYMAVCDYAREHTPVDAVFLVPPGEQEFRLYARRAIVINFKGVAQLSSELGEWHDRMCAVLDLPKLQSLTNRYADAFPALTRRYEALPAEHLIDVAHRYDAHYVVLAHDADAAFGARPVFVSGPYRLYDLQTKK